MWGVSGRLFKDVGVLVKKGGQGSGKRGSARSCLLNWAICSVLGKGGVEEVLRGTLLLLGGVMRGR